MKTTKTAPKWAIELTTQVCKDYKRTLPEMLQWYATSYTNSSGMTWRRMNKIHVSASSNGADHRVVLLHELAHYILHKSRKGRAEAHSIRFWRLAFELYERYGVDLEYAYGREKHYRANATWAYQELKEKNGANRSLV